MSGTPLEKPPTWEVLRRLSQYTTEDAALEKLLQDASTAIESELKARDYVIGLLGSALDEIWELRAGMAIEALETLGHTELATFPKSRRKPAAEQVYRQRQAARGEVFDAYRGHRDTQKLALREAGADVLLTQGTWVNELHKRTAKP